jgi:hypothetical protein
MWAWNFDSISGTSIPDTSWRWNTWTLSGSTLPVSVSWQAWNALNFSSTDGTSWGYIEYAASSDVDTWTFTFSFWLNIDNPIDWSSYSQIAKNYSIDSVNNDIIFTFQWDSIDLEAQKRCRVKSVNWWDYDAYIKSDIAISIWNHVVCTFDGERVSVYLNWELEDSTYVSEPINRWKASMKIGAGWPSFVSTNNYFDGKLDEVYLYKKPLSWYEVKILYDATK